MRDPIETGILVLARRQQRSVTRQQLLGLGLSPWAIVYRVRQGRLHRTHTNVYTVGPPPGTPVERAAAALLACGSEAALSHTSALALWGLATQWPSAMHITAPGQRRRAGIVSHISHVLNRGDVRSHLGIRVTSPARTLIDCAPELGRARTHRIAADARRAGLLHAGQIADVVARFPRHPGAGHLTDILSDGGPPTRSGFEDLFPAFCALHQLPVPQLNVRVAGREVDAWFAAQGVIVELDGWDFHRDRHNFEGDRLNDAVALGVGLVTYRLTWPRFNHEPAREARRLRAVLANRGSRPGQRSGRRA